jgi:triphosphatase
MSQECSLGKHEAEHAIRTQLEKIRAHIAGVSELDEMAIHDMRVASRRLRMALKVYRPYLKKGARKALNRKAIGITRALGRRRELDVMLSMLRDHRDETTGLWLRFMDHAIAILETRCAAAATSCLECASVAGDATMSELEEATIASLANAQGCLHGVAEAALLDALDEVRDARKFWKRNGEADDLHDVRVAIKKFRYACEFHKHLYGEAMDAYIAQLRVAQATLGEWNECRLLEEMIQILGNAAPFDIAQGAPLVAEAYGGRAAVLEEQFREQGKALFSREGSRGFRKLLRKLAKGCCLTEK